MSDPTPSQRYTEEADELDRVLRSGLAVLQDQADSGQLGAVEHALLRVKVMEQHLAESRALRIRHFGGTPE